MTAVAQRVNTKKVSGRRELRFSSLDEILSDVDKLAAAGAVRALGNWTPGQIMDHLARTFDSAVDGIDARMPWYVRWGAPLMKKGFLTKPMKAGFQLPSSMQRHLGPDDMTIADGTAKLRRAIDRYRQSPQRAPHVVFGKITDAEWDLVHLRHCELHLSFLVPV